MAEFWAQIRVVLVYLFALKLPKAHKHLAVSGVQFALAIFKSSQNEIPERQAYLSNSPFRIPDKFPKCKPLVWRPRLVNHEQLIAISISPAKCNNLFSPTPSFLSFIFCRLHQSVSRRSPPVLLRNPPRFQGWNCPCPR